MNTTLLIMAAGIGSRFGTGIKQLEPVDASNHIIMDYSIDPAVLQAVHPVLSLPFLTPNPSLYLLPSLPFLLHPDKRNDTA